VIVDDAECLQERAYDKLQIFRRHIVPSLGFESGFSHVMRALVSQRYFALKFLAHGGNELHDFPQQCLRGGTGVCQQ